MMLQMLNYPTYSFLLQAFGLQNVKTAIYASNIGAVGNETAEYSYLGTPVFDVLYLDTEGDNLRIDTVLIELNRPKNIVKTSIQGIDGTVKEFISDGDYQISIKGMIVGESSDFPEDDIATLRDILDKKVSIRVTSKFMNLFKIDDIVIVDRTFKQVEGFENIQMFEIQALSDKAIELILSE